MAEGKWIEDVGPSTPVVEAARRVLEVRLGTVGERLPPALFEADQDPEHVHQLRVASRRAGAALRTFRDCFPRKQYKKVRNRLRKVRRAAGAARDADVFLETLAKRMQRPRPGQRPGLDFLLGYAWGERAAAQEQLLAANEKTAASWDDFQEDALAAIESPGHGLTAGDLAVSVLPQLARELADAASQDLQAYEHLHRVRILGKRLRYALEIFSGCYDTAMREVHYAAVETMQDILGLANDSYVATQRLTIVARQLEATRPREWKRLRPGIEAMIQYHERRLPQQRRKFERWWHEWQQSAAEAAFARLLRHVRKGA
jgi:CHAD domain-containing protein